MFQEYKKTLLLSADLIVTIIFSFVIVIGFSLALHTLDIRLQDTWYPRPFGEYEKVQKSSFWFTPTPLQRTSAVVRSWMNKNDFFAKLQTLKFTYLKVWEFTPTIAEAAVLSRAADPTEPLFAAKKIITSSSSLELGKKEKAHFEVGFKNIGKEILVSTHDTPITLRSFAQRESYFYDSSWKSGTVIAELTTPIRPGEVEYLSFFLEAPDRAGSYREKLALYRGSAQVSQSSFLVPIRVGAVSVGVSQKKQMAVQAVSVQRAVSGADLVTQKLIQSDNQLTIAQGQKKFFEVGFKNTNSTPWKAQSVGLRSSATKESYFYDSSWQDKSMIVTLKNDVQPGELVYFSFFLEAPFMAGAYHERLYLISNSKKIVGSEFSLPITVTKFEQTVLAYAPTPLQAQQLLSSDPQAIQQQSTPEAATQSIVVRIGVINDFSEQEKSVRVGLYNATEPVLITADKDFAVVDGNGAQIVVASNGATATVTFDSSTRITTVQVNDQQFSTDTYYRFQSLTPQDVDIVFELPSYVNRPGWSSTINDNKYRGSLEVRYAPKTDKVWVINELSLEQYLKGIAETSNNSPYEYQKALIVAARTFAKYHIERATKYLGENFMVRPTDADQVYRGYNSEVRLASVARAVQETRGIMVYYNNQLAITPYFSQSDGRTRSWEEVWAGGPKPWLIGKDDPVGQGLQLLGHGVGMSARGALSLALEGKNFQDILTYYYTGVELRKRYE